MSSASGRWNHLVAREKKPLVPWVPFLLLALSFSSYLGFSFVNMILEFIGLKKSAFWRLFTQMTANFVRFVLKKPVRYMLFKIRSVNQLHRFSGNRRLGGEGKKCVALETGP